MESGKISFAQKAVEDQLLRAADVIETQIDNELAKLDNLDEDGLESIRQKRLKQLKESSKLKDEWIANGHGVYEEVSDEKVFFNLCKKSKRVVCHFYRESTMRCKIFDKHLAALAPKHLECKIVKLDVNKSPFLTKRLNVFVIPTLLIFVDDKVTDRVVGFDDLGGHDEFSTEMLEWRLGVSRVINYDGALDAPPDLMNKKTKASMLGGMQKKTVVKTIRGKKEDSDSDDDY